MEKALSSWSAASRRLSGVGVRGESNGLTLTRGEEKKGIVSSVDQT
jgi:hypothetical protein